MNSEMTSNLLKINTYLTNIIKKYYNFPNPQYKSMVHFNQRNLMTYIFSSERNRWYPFHMDPEKNQSWIIKLPNIHLTIFSDLVIINKKYKFEFDYYSEIIQVIPAEFYYDNLILEIEEYTYNGL